MTRLPPVDSPAYRHLTWVTSNMSEWYGKLLAPIDAPLLSRTAALDIAFRVRYVVATALVAVVVALYRYYATQPTHSHVPTPPSTPTATTKGAPPLSPIEEEALALETYFYEQLMGNVSLVRQQAGITFKQRITAFFQKYFEQRENQAFKDVRYISNNFNFLYRARIALFMPGQFRIDEKGIVPMPSDGNCLFSSLATGYSLLERKMDGSEIFPDFNPLDHASIRKKVTEWMRENINTDAELCFYLIQAVLDYCPIYRRQIEDNVEKNESLAVGQGRLELFTRLENDREVREAQQAFVEQPEIGFDRFLQLAARADIREALLAYIEKTSFDKEFGASPHTHAFSRILDIRVIIERHYEFPGKNGSPAKKGINENSDPPFNPRGSRSITLVYNLSGDHLDLHVKR